MSSYTFSLFPPQHPQKRYHRHVKSRSSDKTTSTQISASLTKVPTTALVASMTTKGKTLDGESDITVHATTVIKVDSPSKKSRNNEIDPRKGRRRSLKEASKVAYPIVPKRTPTPGESKPLGTAASPSAEKQQAGEAASTRSQNSTPALREQSPVQRDWSVTEVATPHHAPWVGLSTAQFPPSMPTPPPRPDPMFQNASASPSSATPKSATTATPSTYEASPSTAPTSVYTSPRMSIHAKFTPPVPQGAFNRSASPPISPSKARLLNASPPPGRHRSPSPALRIRTELSRGPSPPPATPPPQPIQSIFPMYNPTLPLHQQSYYPAIDPAILSTSPPRNQISRDYSPNISTAGSPPLLLSPPHTQTSFHQSKDPDTIGIALSPASDQEMGGPLGGFVHFDGAGGAITALPKASVRAGHGPVFPAPPKEDFDGAKGEKKRRRKYEEKRAKAHEELQAKAREDVKLEAARAAQVEMVLASQGRECTPNSRRKKSAIKRFFALILRGRW